MKIRSIRSVFAEERWRPIPGYDGRYEVSDRGRVRSFLLSTKGAVLGGQRRSEGVQFALYGPDGRVRYARPWVLVEETFGSPCWAELWYRPEKDAKVSNASKGLRGECNGRSKLTWARAEELRQRYAAGGITHRALARELGVAKSTVGRVVRGATWVPSKGASGGG